MVTVSSQQALSVVPLMASRGDELVRKVGTGPMKSGWETQVSRLTQTSGTLNFFTLGRGF